MADNQLDNWIASLEERHFRELRFPEVSRALKALSATYVERRAKLGEGAALTGAGKRAAFALFYGPLHFLIVREVVAQLTGAGRASGAVRQARGGTIVDLGCGTGAGGAAWATASDRAHSVLGIDRNAWALDEAALTYRQFDLNARTRRGDITRMEVPKPPVSWLAAFTLNELADSDRETVLTRLLERAAQGDRVLVIEPIARGIAPWWDRWKDRVITAGGRADEWRFRVPLPPIVSKLDRAAGMDHRELTARSLWHPGT
jgi:hypothetical protein